MYDQKLGRFLSPDPLAEEGPQVVGDSPEAERWRQNRARHGYTRDDVVRAMANPYAYASNNPVNLVDPSGLQEEAEDFINKKIDETFRVLGETDSKRFNNPKFRRLIVDGILANYSLQSHAEDFERLSPTAIAQLLINRRERLQIQLQETYETLRNLEVDPNASEFRKMRTLERHTRLSNLAGAIYENPLVNPLLSRHGSIQELYAFRDALEAKAKLTEEDKRIIGRIQTILDTAGLFPVVGEGADFVSGLISLWQGDLVGAGASAVSMFPIVGDLLGKGTKFGRRFVDSFDDIADTARGFGRSEGGRNVLPRPSKLPAPVRARIISQADEALAPLAKQFPDAKVGFRGSLAQGTKGAHKGGGPFDPTDFDVDAFIVSDELAAAVPKDAKGFRNLGRLPEHRGLIKSISDKLRSIPGHRATPVKIRVFSADEFKKLTPDEIHLLQ